MGWEPPTIMHRNAQKGEAPLDRTPMESTELLDGNCLLRGSCQLGAHQFALAAHKKPRPHQSRMTQQLRLLPGGFIKQPHARDNSERIRLRSDEQQLPT